MKNLIVTLIAFVALGLPAAAAPNAHEQDTLEAQGASAADTIGIVAYSDTTAADTAVATGGDGGSNPHGMWFGDVDDPLNLVAYLSTIGAGGVIVAVFVVILGLLFLLSPFIVIALILYFLFKRNKDRYRMAEKAMETGQPMPEGMRATEFESSEALWRKGVKNFFIGLGLIAVFLSLGIEELTGIGILVALYGAGQGVIARTTQKKDDKDDDDFKEEL